MKTWLAIMFLSAVSFLAGAQNEEKDEYDENYEFPETKKVDFSFGLGFGLDYGGIGGRITFIPTPKLGLFGSIGYNFNGAGYNGGVIYRILPESKVCPFVTGMYGYNAVIVVDGYDEANKTYYGASFGAGIELHRRDKPNYWNFGILFPLRSQEYLDDLEVLQNDPNIEITDDLLPFTISVGYHFSI